MENGSSDRAMRRAIEERNCKALQMLIRSGASRMLGIKDGWKEDVVWCIIQLGAFDLLEVYVSTTVTPVIPRQCDTMPFQLRGDTCVAKARIPTV